MHFSVYLIQHLSSVHIFFGITCSKCLLFLMLPNIFNIFNISLDVLSYRGMACSFLLNKHSQLRQSALNCLHPLVNLNLDQSPTVRSGSSMRPLVSNLEPSLESSISSPLAWVISHEYPRSSLKFCRSAVLALSLRLSNHPRQQICSPLFSTAIRTPLINGNVLNCTIIPLLKCCKHKYLGLSLK